MVHSYMFKVCIVFVCMVAWSTVTCLRFVLYLCVWWYGPQLHVQGLCCICAYGGMVHCYMFKVCVVFVCMVIWSTVMCSRFVLYLCVWWYGPQLHVQGLCCICVYGGMVHSYMFKVCVYGGRVSC